MKLKSLAIIPARGGSKRIPRKNINLFNGFPIIKYPIDAALKSGCFDETIVSTDDKEIAELSKKFGAGVPFIRSGENSNDTAGLNLVVEEILNKLVGSGREFEHVCCLLPTAVFITPQTLRDTYDSIAASGADALFPVVKYSYSIQRALRIENNALKMIWPENYNKRSQDLSPSYHDAGQFYWLKTSSFLEQKIFFMKNVVPVVMDELDVQDIDTESDWKAAELKFKNRKTVSL